MSLDSFFNPKTVAVIGASQEQHKIGATIFRNFLSGWKGKVIPINPNKKVVLKQKAYPSVLNYRDKIDQAIIAVPAVVVPKVLKECVEKEIPAVVIVTSGFKEIGKKSAEQELLEIIRGSKTRIIGPNCLGLYDAYSKTNSVFLPLERFNLPGKGKIGVISQSGAVGSALLDILADEGIGVSKFISYGNALDIDESDLVTHLSKDKHTDVIVGYIEGIKNGKRFMRACRESSKPIVLLKAGRYEENVKAVQSHTGSLAGSYDVYSGVMKQLGVATVDDWEGLLDVAKAHLQKTPRGDKVFVVTDGGGFGVLAADSAVEQGLDMPQPSNQLLKNLKKMPDYATLRNPLDVTGDATSERYKLAIEAALKSKEYDAIVVITLWQIPTLDVKTVDEIVSLNKKYKTPIYVVAPGSEYTRRIVEKLEENGVPVYQTPHRAMQAIAKVLDSR